MSNLLDNVEILMECCNQGGGGDLRIVVPFKFSGTTPDGHGQASSAKVQFNVNKPAVRGTIFVDKRNDGICVAKITSRHRVTGGHWVFNPEGSHTDNNDFGPQVINNCVSCIPEVTANNEVVFAVKHVDYFDGKNHVDYRGNVTLTFFVHYIALT
jgi:hypothetical protein